MQASGRAATPLVPEAISNGLEAARRSSNLAFALFFLPRPRRADMVEFYRFCRTVDDIADSPELPGDLKRSTLDAWTRALRDPALAAVPPGFAEVIRRHALDREMLCEIVAGMRSDLEFRHYDSFEDLRGYCWRAASAVGLAALPILGASPAARRYAESLGIALQLTNILRDLAEDAERGRIYLPLDDLARFGVARDDILRGRMTRQFSDLLAFETARARGFFKEAVDLLPPDDRSALRAPEIMRLTYSKLLRRMESEGFPVYAKRVRVSKPEKCWIGMRVLFGLA